MHLKTSFFWETYFKWRPMTPPRPPFSTLLHWRVQAVILWQNGPARIILRRIWTPKIDYKNVFLWEIDILQRLLTSSKPHFKTSWCRKIQGQIILKYGSSERMSRAVGPPKCSLNAPKNKFFGKTYFKWRPLTLPRPLFWNTITLKSPGGDSLG